MKCANCNSCLDIYNIEIEGVGRLYWLCDLCRKLYKLQNGRRFEVTDEQEYDFVRQAIINKHKEAIDGKN